MNPSLKSPNQALQTLNTIFYALITGVLIFFLIIHLGFQQKEDVPPATDLALIFNYLVPFFCIIQGGLSIFIFDTQMKKMPQKQGLKEKMSFYFQFKLIQWALLEGAALFAIIAYALTGFPMYALWCLLMVMLIAFHKPSSANFTKYATLTAKEDTHLQADKFE